MDQNAPSPTFPRYALLSLALFGAALLLLVVSQALTASSNGGAALSFGEGLPVQLVDPAGRNGVQFVAYDARPTATLQLYGLTPTRFISFYNALPGNWWQEDRLDPAGLPLVAEWQVTVHDTYAMQTTTLPAVPPGFYLLTLSDAITVHDELLVALSSDALLLKTGTVGDVTQVVAWASRLSSGEPLSGTAVTIYDDQGQALASGLTDAGGLYVAWVTGVDPQALVAVGSTGPRWTACGTRGEWNSRGTPYSQPATVGSPYKAYLYTDRPIYRPGHTVHYKGILRRDDDGDYTPLPATQPVTLTVRDARDNVLSTATRYPSRFGTISGTFTLAQEPGLGEYHLEATLGGYTFRQPFKVEAYRKPEYAVAVNTPESYYVWGDPISITVAADYYFGQPVTGAEAELAVYWQSGGYGSRHQVWKGTGVTDQAGHWTATIQPTDYPLGDATLILQATVSDESHQSVSGERRVPIYYAEYALTMSLDQYGYAPGEAVTVSLSTQEHDGTPATGTPLSVTLSGWADGDYRQVDGVTATTGAEGTAQVVFDVPDPGWYKLQAQGQDGRGRTVAAHAWFWVYSASDDWHGQPEETMSVSADKSSYAPGEVAQLLVRSPVTGTALLSLERGRTRQAYPVQLTDTVTLIQLPIQADHVPNIFATVSIPARGRTTEEDHKSLPEGQLLLGSVELTVPATEQVLQVELLPDRATYRPRETVTFTVRVRDRAGDPVVAEVSLGLVDEAIYALSEDLSADLRETFYGRRGQAVTSYDTLQPQRFFYRWSYPPGPTPTALPTATPGAPPTDSGDDDVRRYFPDTAYWHPGITTDEQGQAVISFTLPDNLTRWRALARAVSTDMQVGEATTAITVTQELIVRPALPRFLVQGDLVRLRAVAHNYQSRTVTATVGLDADGLVLLCSGTATHCSATAYQPGPFPLSPGGTGVVDRSAVASQVGQASVLARLWTTSTAGGSATLWPPDDAVELSLPVYPFAIPELVSRVGQVTHEITETIYVPVTALPDATSLKILLSSSIALGLLDGLEYLITYPFG